MHKFLWVFLFFLTINTSILSQNIKNTQDSLRLLLLTPLADTTKIDILLQLGKNTIYSTPDDALFYLHKALKMSVLSQDIKREIAITNFLGAVFRNINQYDSALYYHEHSLQLSKKINYQKGVFKNLGNIANIYAVQQNFPKAMQYYQDALEEAKNANDEQTIGIILMNIGNLYYLENKYEKVLEYYQEALPYLEKAQDKRHINLLYSNLSSVYVSMGNHTNAIFYASKSLAVAEEIGDKQSAVVASLALFDIYFAQKNLAEAEKFSQKALKNAQEGKSLEHQISSLKRMIKLAKANNNAQKAVQYLEELLLLKDSLFAQEQKASVEKLNRSIENIKARHTQQAAQNKDIQQQKTIHRQTVLLWIGTIAGIAISVLAGFSYNEMRKVRVLNQEIKEKNETMLQQNFLLQVKQKEIKDFSENLEKIIQARTHALNQRNQQLRQYAFTNAHTLRGLIANLLGLYQIYLMADSMEEKEKLLGYFNQVVEKVDAVIHQIQKNLDTIEEE